MRGPRFLQIPLHNIMGTSGCPDDATFVVAEVIKGANFLRWKERIEQRLLALEDSANIQHRSPHPGSTAVHDLPGDEPLAEAPRHDHAATATFPLPPQPRVHGWDLVMDDRGPGVVPASVLSDRSPAAIRHTVAEESDDIISKGLLSLQGKLFIVTAQWAHRWRNCYRLETS